MEYINRIYRSHFQQERWHFFGVQYKESDLYIGVEKNSWHPQMPIFANQQLQALRQEMDHWIIQHPEYAQALKPIDGPSCSINRHWPYERYRRSRCRTYRESYQKAI